MSRNLKLETEKTWPRVTGRALSLGFGCHCEGRMAWPTMCFLVSCSCLLRWHAPYVAETSLLQQFSCLSLPGAGIPDKAYHTQLQTSPHGSFKGRYRRRKGTHLYLYCKRGVVVSQTEMPFSSYHFFILTRKSPLPPSATRPHSLL